MMSLSQRVLFSATLVLLAFIVGIALTLDRAFYDSARLGVQDRLFAKLLMLMSDAEIDDAGVLDLETNLIDAELGHVNSSTYGFVIDQVGTILWRSTSSLNENIPVTSSLDKGTKIFEQTVFADQTYFIYRYAVAWETPTGEYPLTFVVITDTTLFDAQITQYREDLWGWLIALIALLLFMQMLVLRWGLKPLRHVSVELAAIESGMQENLKGNYPSELKLLTDNINSLINHEHKQQKRYRNGLADLAHSLKTPLAVLQGAVNSEEDEVSRRKVIHEQIDRMDSIVQYQLRRAVTAGGGTGMTLVLLKPMVDRIVNTVQKAYRTKQSEIDIQMDDVIGIRIDEGDLMELLGNLIDNAFKWCRYSIQICAECLGNQVAIQVKDDGPGIPSQEADRILERCVRADQSIPGHGIGLAIVHDIIQAYDGKMTIANNPAGGACITLYLKK
ncbi:two-component system, OmpR family, sensor histidine kinase PhoQ [Nitrosomonas sp. PY1]|uniref:ATP-binding protein n=1 Tax=Nitrosomonas sp. PY1 TaxID=1803906 RepID=UPI001FC7C309|nr:ATP-binding protein [Nitrosomonas sp. PY1]GKS69128.1 two-component system, OmpR family, sensor histidine kinase PhoQ [Nitrosomonas sp. PY1]